MKPQHAFDCENCKYSWCCGPLCACHHDYAGPIKDMPRARVLQVVQLRRKAGYRGAARELLQKYRKSAIDGGVTL